jgi:hypothetical protein
MHTYIFTHTYTGLHQVRRPFFPHQYTSHEAKWRDDKLIPRQHTCTYIHHIYTHIHTYMHTQGSIKFAGRFFLISIHPMKLNGTMMNSFLFKHTPTHRYMYTYTHRYLRTYIHHLYIYTCMHTQGSIKFAGRFFLISIHPMKLNGTMMNSFLFNVGLLLICTVSVTQLCATAFRQYAHSSAISQIFVSQIQYLKVIMYNHVQHDVCMNNVVHMHIYTHVHTYIHTYIDTYQGYICTNTDTLI